MNRILKLLISAIYYSISEALGIIRRLSGVGNGIPFVVLMYHSVKRESITRFNRQIEYILKAGQIVPLDFDGSATGKFAVAITFDDGFLSVVENALPFLTEKKIRSTMFIPTGHLGKRAPWINEPTHENYGETVIDPDVLKGLSSKMVMIGSHAVTHANLTQMPSEEISRELVESKRYLEGILGKEVRFHAFPYGEFDDSVVALSRSAGYEKVFAGDPIAERSSADSFIMGRIGVTPEDWNLEFWLKCRGAYQWLPSGIAAKRKIRSLLP